MMVYGVYGHLGLCASPGCPLSAVQTNAPRDQIEPSDHIGSWRPRKSRI